MGNKGVSKVQKEYFESRLRNIVAEKEAQARNKYPTQITVMELTELIDKGEVRSVRLGLTEAIKQLEAMEV